VTGDISDADSVRRAVRAAADQLGGLDVLVNNAGVGSQGRVQDHTDEDWRQVLEVNVVGTARVSREAWPFLVASAHAAVVNVSSIAATAGLPDRVVYSASKGAISAMTRAMAADGMPDGVRVNAVNPGTADTPWVGRLLAAADDPAAERAALEARQPHGRLVAAEEVAGAVAYLVSPAAGSTTGVELAVDGGMAALRLRPRT
jgi:NAD(P)-dependent dehydrogenase (short-subunit alcohol dehydrogenase family)